MLMKINQIIREKRKELSLTQEQIAELLLLPFFRPLEPV